MNTKQLVKVLRKWHISPDADVYCPQCWGKYLSKFDKEMLEFVKSDSHDANLPRVRNHPMCSTCKRVAS